jgi:hypothetical protein
MYLSANNRWISSASQNFLYETTIQMFQEETTGRMNSLKRKSTDAKTDRREN